MRDETTTLTPQMLLHAYQAGIFPMAESRDDSELFWVDPRRRGIIPINDFHISRSLARHMRSANWTIRINTDFDGVVAACPGAAGHRRDPHDVGSKGLVG